MDPFLSHMYSSRTIPLGQLLKIFISFLICNYPQTWFAKNLPNWKIINPKVQIATLWHYGRNLINSLEIPNNSPLDRVSLQNFKRFVTSNIISLLFFISLLDIWYNEDCASKVFFNHYYNIVAFYMILCKNPRREK
jgi:hypothetical protein